MKLRYKKIKMEDAYSIIKNNNRAVLSICNSGTPHCIPIYYDTDCFCGCLKLYFEACKCGEIMDNIMNNDSACIFITNNYNGCTDTVALEGTATILPEEVDCCCCPENDCGVTIEFTPSSVIGKRYSRC